MSLALRTAPLRSALAGPRRRSRPLLLVLKGRDRPRECLLRALELAERRAARLELLRVLPGRSRLERLRGAYGALDALKQRRELHRETSRWVQSELGRAGRSVRVVIAQGRLAQQAAKRARLLGAGLVVLSPGLGQSGSLATSLARAARASVLVQRGSVGGRAILAATDLRDEKLPVLRQAAQYAREPEAELIAFHNVDPLAVMAGNIVGAAPAPAAASTLERRELLGRVSSELPVPASAIVRTELDPVKAILDEARQRDAGMIVVGTHAGRHWWERVLRGSVAERVIAQAERPVLVTPLSVS